MRIVHVYKDSYPPVLGGIEQHIEFLAKLQAQAGHEVEVLVAGGGRRGERFTHNGVKVTRLPEFGRAASSPLTVAYARAFRRRTADVAHFHHPNPIGELFEPLLPTGTARVVSYHADITRQRVLAKAYRPLLERFLRRAAVIVTSSERLRESSPLLGPHRYRVRVVPYAPEPPESSYAPPRTRDALFVGRLREYKGIGVLVEALSSAPMVRLRIVGRGPMEDELRVACGRLGVADRVKFLGDVDAATLDAEYRRARLLVLPSTRRSEAFGIVLAEALIRGTPLLSTELGTGTSWVNLDHETGLVVPPNDPIALASALTRMTVDDVAWARFAAGARQRADLFSPSSMLAGIEAIYAEAVR